MVFPCEGQVKNGDRVVLPPEGPAKVQWQFNIQNIKDVKFRSWHFTSSDGTLRNELLATISDDEEAVMETKLLAGLEIEKPATLVLKNVNQSYNGSYKFTIIGTGIDGAGSAVTIIIAVTPKMKIECSKPTTINKGEDFTCVCRGEDGNPPASVTWFNEGGEKVSKTEKEMATLALSNVDKNDSGKYKCKAFGDKLAQNETSIKLVVQFPPENVRVLLSSEIAVRGKSFTVKCEAEAEPAPRFKIFFNETEVSISEDTYTIPKVNDSHVGFYKCVANNTLGLKTSSPRHLRVGNAETHGNDGDDVGLSTGAIVGIIIGVLVLVLVVAIVCLLKLKKSEYDKELLPVMVHNKSMSNFCVMYTNILDILILRNACHYIRQAETFCLTAVWLVRCCKRQPRLLCLGTNGRYSLPP